MAVVVSNLGYTEMAAAYAASSVNSWVQTLALQAAQALSHIKFMELQKKQYDEITASQRKQIDKAVDRFQTTIDNMLTGDAFERAYPDIPECAEYVPVDVTAEQHLTILKNLAELGEAEDYIEMVNHIHHVAQQERVNFFLPLFKDSWENAELQVNTLLHGELPVDDVIEILTDRAEADCLANRIGNSRNTTLRDLGISRLRAQAAGRMGLYQQLEVLNGHVSPIQFEADVRTMMLDPGFRINVALDQALKVQASLQNCYNRDAQKPPYRMAELQMKIQKSIMRLQYMASKAAVVNAFVPNYAAALNPLVDAFSNNMSSRMSMPGPAPVEPSYPMSPPAQVSANNLAKGAANAGAVSVGASISK